jgi:hypothetical protein
MFAATGRFPYEMRRSLLNSVKKLEKRGLEPLIVRMQGSVEHPRFSG